VTGPLRLVLRMAAKLARTSGFTPSIIINVAATGKAGAPVPSMFSLKLKTVMGADSAGVGVESCGGGLAFSAGVAAKAAGVVNTSGTKPSR